MITKQTFDIVNKNGDVMESFPDYGKAMSEFKNENPNYVKLVQRQRIERVISERKVDKNGNAVYEKQ